MIVVGIGQKTKLNAKQLHANNHNKPIIIKNQS